MGASGLHQTMAAAFADGIGLSGYTPGTTGHEINQVDEWKIARDALVVLVPNTLHDGGVTNITRQ